MLSRVFVIFICLALNFLHLEGKPKQVVILSYAEVDQYYNLNTAGKDRASKLPDYFKSLADQGYPLPEIIFGAKRSTDIPGNAVIDTATPLSRTLRLPIHPFPSSDISGLVQKVLHHPSCEDKSVLVVWNADSINDLITAFGYTPQQPGTAKPGYCLTNVLSYFPAAGNIPPTVLNQNLLPGDGLCGGITPPTPPPPVALAGYIPVTIYNGTTSAIVNGQAQPVDASQIFLLFQANGGTSVLQFSPDGSGNMVGSPITPAPVAGNATSFYSSFYSYPLSYFPSPASGFYTFYLPASIMLPSSRIYFSVINPIDWLVNPNTGVILSEDDSFVTSDNTYYTLYDKIEFTITNASLPFWQLVMNSTMVDYYCLPLSFYINYISNSESTTSYTGLSPSFSRECAFTTYKSNLAALPGAGVGTWDALYTSYTSPKNVLTNLRLVSANSGALKPTNANPLFPMSYLNANPNSSCQWLTSLWNNPNPPPSAYYNVNGAGNTITLDLTNAGPNAGTAIGQVDNGGNFVFNLNSDSQWYPGTVSFQSPVTIAPFFSGAFTDYVNPLNNAALWSISGNATTDTITAVWQIFSCAFNVGLLPPPSPIGTPSSPLTKAWLQSQISNFFQSNASLCDGPWFNFYSKVLHVDLAESPYLNYYTAPFDDFLNIDGTITVTDILGVNANANVNVTIGDLTGTSIPNILDDPTVYNVTFAILPANVANVTFNGTAVPSNGGAMGSTPGSTMALSLQYATGSYSTTPATTFITQISPNTGTMSPKLPGGANITVAGNNVTIYVGDAPP